METKEAILSTISELSKLEFENKKPEDSIKNEDFALAKDTKNILIDIKEDDELDSKNEEFDDEMNTLLKLKDKSLVLFEGLRSSKNLNLQVKLEMVINYLEYQLYVIEDRLNVLQDKQKDGKID